MNGGKITVEEIEQLLDESSLSEDIVAILAGMLILVGVDADPVLRLERKENARKTLDLLITYSIMPGVKDLEKEKLIHLLNTVIERHCK